MGPFLGEHDSHFFQTFNHNKKSVCLNLKTTAGRDAFRRLAATSHVVLNNLRGDQPEKLGLTYAALRDVNPRLLCAHLSAYGRDNERKGWPGYDYLMQAEAGYLHVTGEPGSPPARMGLSIVDYMTGITTALAVVAGLLGVARDGQGRDIDVSLFDVALHQLSYPGTWYLNAGQETTRLPRSSHPSATPVQLFKTADGWIFVMCMTEKFWRNLIEALGRDDLGADPRFATMSARREHREELTEVLDGILAARTTAQWLAQLRHLLPAAPVLTLGAGARQPVRAGHGDGAPPAASTDARLSGARQPDQAGWRAGCRSRRLPRSAPTPTRCCAASAMDDAALEILRRQEAQA